MGRLEAEKIKAVESEDYDTAMMKKVGSEWIHFEVHVLCVITTPSIEGIVRELIPGKLSFLPLRAHNFCSHI